MKNLAKIMTGAATAALASVTFAAPAQAQFGYDRYDRGYNRGSIVGDLITGIAVAGGIAAVTSAIGRDGSRYGYGSRYRYRDGYTAAVNSCSYEAERIGRGRVRITDIDRTGGDRYRVRGVVELDSGYGGYGSYGGYDRNDRYGSYGRYDRNDRYGSYGRYDRYGSYGRYDRNDRYGSYGRYGRYDRNDRYGYGYGRDRDDFTCHAFGNGRISDFRI